jgi:hypothetical protein
MTLYQVQTQNDVGGWLRMTVARVREGGESGFRLLESANSR